MILGMGMDIVEIERLAAAIERSGDGILITPVTERPSISQLFAMIDEARSEEGDLVIDRNINMPTTSKEYF